MKIDETTISIMRLLKDGSISCRKIGLELGIAEKVIRDRINQLIKEGLIDIIGQCDPHRIKDYQVAFMGIKLAAIDRLLDTAEKLSQLNSVLFTTVVTGRFDIFMQVLLKKEWGLLDFYTHELILVDGIESIETFIAYQGFNTKIPLENSSTADI